MTGRSLHKPPIPIRDVAGLYLIAGRNWVLTVGVQVALQVLMSALVLTDGIFIATMWFSGMCSTFRGTAERRGKGAEVTLPLADHGRFLAHIASLNYAKGDPHAGFCRSLATSRYGGSSNDEFLSRTGLFGDCDDCGAPDLLLEILHRLGIAYIFQRRPGTTRWHIEIPFARPIARPLDAGTPDDLTAWTRRYYRAAMGWLLGILSELGGLACHLEPHRGAISVSHMGLDGASANRLIVMGNPYTRRELNDPVPETRWREGLFLDVEALLKATGFEPAAEEPPRARRSAKRVDADANTAAYDETDADEDAPQPPDSDEPEPRQMEALGEAVVAAFAQANLVTLARGPLALVRCPFRDGHSTGSDGDSSTAIMPNGFVKCLHGSCSSRTQDDFLRALPIESQYAVLERLSAIAAEDEDAIFAPSLRGIAAPLSVIDPTRFAKVCGQFDGSRQLIERWMYVVRKGRRS